MRVAFTIIYNGLHHLQHKGYAEYMAKHLDYWVFVDGLSSNGGSTSWCKNIEGCSSDDGTVEFIQDLQKKYPNIILQTCTRKWPSKDAMVNKAIELLIEKTNHAFLWEIDADEQWTHEIMSLSEQILKEKGGKTGMFHANYYVGNRYVAKGMWGEGIGLPYRRLWDWNGEYFLKHEPPTLMRGNKREILIDYRFDHYAYYFDKDVEFKSKFYGGHEMVYENIKRLNRGEIRVPCDLKSLFGHRRTYFNSTTIRAI